MRLPPWLFGKRPLALDLTPTPVPCPVRRPAVRHTLSLPSGLFRFIALDVGTANAKAASICQTGLTCVRHDGTIHVASTLIDPEQPFSDLNVGLHGVGPVSVRGAPTFPDVLRQLAPLLSQHLVIQHSTFDRAAINGACRAYGLSEVDWLWADSVQIARRAWPEFRSGGGHGLAHLKQALGLEFEHHDAGEDAKAAAMVVLRAEAHTGQALEALIASPTKPRPKASRPQAGRTSVDASEFALHIEQLSELVGFMSEARPLTRADRENLWKATSRRALSGVWERGYRDERLSGTQAFFRLPEVDVRQHLRTIDNNLRAQVDIVATACRAYFETGEVPAPHYAWRIVIILSRAKALGHERAFLGAWCLQFKDVSGGRYGDLVRRAEKRGVGS